jgi:pimeloyl-ACP methyl ester carboxylesterase
MSYDAMATDLETLLDSEHLDQVCLAGHSMGGKVAMQFALTRPQRVTKLVVLDISPKPYPPKHDTILRALLALDLSRFTARREMEEALASEIPDLSVRRFLLKNVRRTEAGAFIWRLDLRAIADNYREISAGLCATSPWQGPALFLRGDRSDYIHDSDYAQITELFPHAQFAIIKGAQHWLHADAPHDVVGRITHFLGE